MANEDKSFTAYVGNIIEQTRHEGRRIQSVRYLKITDIVPYGLETALVDISVSAATAEGEQPTDVYPIVAFSETTDSAKIFCRTGSPTNLIEWRLISREEVPAKFSWSDEAPPPAR